MTQFLALRAEGSVLLWGLGRPAQALAACEKALALTREGEATHSVNLLRVQLAVAHIQLDHLDVARELLPDRSLDPLYQVDELWAEVRLALDSGRQDAALPSIQEVLRGGPWPRRTDRFLSDIAVEALVALGRTAEAQRLVERVAAGGSDPSDPWLLRMRGRAAAATGRVDEALADLRLAAETFRTAGYGHEEARSRLALAGVLAEEGSVETAWTELRATLESAEERGAVLEARLARTMQATLSSRA